MTDTTAIRTISWTALRRGWDFSNVEPMAITYHGSTVLLCFPAEFVDGIPRESMVRRIRNWAEWYLEQIGGKG